MTTRISRDEEGLLIAEAASKRADCSRRQVGAAIMGVDGRIISLGRNGLASGLPGCLTEGACPRGRLSYDEQPADVAYEATGCRAIHAEVNAIIRAGRDRCVGATIYVTEEPCFHCSVVIEGAGIVRVVTPTSPRRHETVGELEAHLDLVEGNPAAEIPTPPAGPGELRPPVLWHAGGPSTEPECSCGMDDASDSHHDASCPRGARFVEGLLAIQRAAARRRELAVQDPAGWGGAS